MSYADEQSYEEVVSELKRFKERINEECGIMWRAGEDCVDNMDEDPAASASCTKLSECLRGVATNLELIDGVIAAMEAQIERIREKASKASQY